MTYVPAPGRYVSGRGSRPLPRLARAWTPRDSRVICNLSGTSSVRQLEEYAAALENLEVTPDELNEMGSYATASAFDPWADSRRG